MQMASGCGERVNCNEYPAATAGFWPDSVLVEANDSFAIGFSGCRFHTIHVYPEAGQRQLSVSLTHHSDNVKGL